MSITFGSNSLTHSLICSTTFNAKNRATVRRYICLGVGLLACLWLMTH